jgi:hypothetical protein
MLGIVPLRVPISQALAVEGIAHLGIPEIRPPNPFNLGKPGAIQTVSCSPGGGRLGHPRPARRPVISAESAAAARERGRSPRCTNPISLRKLSDLTRSR